MSIWNKFLFMFHLHEFRGDSQDAYGGLTDAQLVDVCLSTMPKGGLISIFTGSFAGDKATATMMAAVAAAKVKRLADYKSLQFYEKL